MGADSQSSENLQNIILKTVSTAGMKHREVRYSLQLMDLASCERTIDALNGIIVGEKPFAVQFSTNVS